MLQLNVNFHRLTILLDKRMTKDEENEGISHRVKANSRSMTILLHLLAIASCSYIWLLYLIEMNKIVEGDGGGDSIDFSILYQKV